LNVKRLACASRECSINWSERHEITWIEPKIDTKVSTHGEELSFGDYASMLALAAGTQALVVVAIPSLPDV
jgi:hypothetical protein